MSGRSLEETHARSVSFSLARDDKSLEKRKGKTMKFGLHGINIGSYSEPELMTEVAQAAEAAGFDSV